MNGVGNSKKGVTILPKLTKPSLAPPSSSGGLQLGGAYERHRLNNVGLKATGYAARQVLNNSSSLDPAIRRINNDRDRDNSADRVMFGKLNDMNGATSQPNIITKP
jgi:hypothetical protein